MTEKSTAVQRAPETTSVKLVEPKSLLERITQIQQDIARRAFEIFEKGGGFWGRDLEDWLKAETELLHPAHLNITESEDALTVRAEVPGFSASDLNIAVEPQRLTISGKKETSTEDKKKGKTVYEERCSNELLRIITLLVEVDPAKTTATLKHGVLEITLPKTAQAKGKRVEVKVA